MGCTPSSTYPDHHRPHFTTSASMPFVPHPMKDTASRTTADDVSLARAHCLSTNVNSRSFGTPSTPPLRLQGSTDVFSDAPSHDHTTYTTSKGRKIRFQHGHPVGFQGAEEVVACLDEYGLDGNLYRLVRSKLRSVGEEVANSVVARGDVADVDSTTRKEAMEREAGMDDVRHTVTTRHRRHPGAGSPADAEAAALQEQYVVALLGTGAIIDSSAVRPSRVAGSARHGAPRNAPTLSPSPAESHASNRTNGALHADEHVTADDDDEDYTLNPQAHYSVLPAQRKAGAPVPAALCPPSRTTRVPVQYSAVEDRVVVAGAAAATTAEAQRSWMDHVKPQRVFRLDTSETRTWAFYNDSEYVMHVFTLFDASSRLEPCDSTRLWSNSVFDAGSTELPTPPPFFFGLFFDEDGEEAVPGSEMPESSARRHRGMFGSPGMWLAELLVPPRCTRVFVEGKVRGAYRMRCTRISLEEMVAATETALAVAKRREQQHLQRQQLNAASRVPAWGRQQHRSVASAGSAMRTLHAVRSAVRKRPSSSATVARPSSAQRLCPMPPGGTHAAGNSPAGSRASSTHLDSSTRTMEPPVGHMCYSTLEESQGVLTRQTYTRRSSLLALAAAAKTPKRTTGSLDATVAHSDAVTREVTIEDVRLGHARRHSSMPPPAATAAGATATELADDAITAHGVQGLWSGGDDGSGGAQEPSSAPADDTSDDSSTDSITSGYAAVRPGRKNTRTFSDEEDNHVNADGSGAGHSSGTFQPQPPPPPRPPRPAGERRRTSLIANVAAPQEPTLVSSSGGVFVVEDGRWRVSPSRGSGGASTLPIITTQLPIFYKGDAASSASPEGSATGYEGNGSARLPTLTPQSSYRSGWPRQNAVGSVASSRTVAVDVSLTSEALESTGHRNDASATV